MRYVIVFALWMSLAAQDRLEREMQRLAEVAGGKVGAAVVHLETGRRVAINGAESFPMASTFKVPVIVKLLERVDAGEVTLDQMVTIEHDDLHPGSGTLNDLFNKPGLALSVRNLMELMMLISDNSAADVCLRLAGGPAVVTAKMKALGYEHIRVDRPTNELIADAVKDRVAFDADPRDTAAPDEMAELLVRIARRQLHKPASADLLLDIMSRCRTGEARLKGLLPHGTPVAHKTGTIARSADDVGILTLPGDAGHVAVAAFVKSSPKEAALRDRAIAEIARAAHDYFVFNPAGGINYVHLAERITGALRLAGEDRVMLGGDPQRMIPLRRELALRCAIASRLDDATVYLDLPLGLGVSLPADEAKALEAWTRAGGAHRQIHFHWDSGAVGEDGLRKPHPPQFDELYEKALDVDYAALGARQKAAADELRHGIVRVTAPGGTDLKFRIGDRPFNFQDGDASRERMAGARVLVDREIELPAGVIRVAPLESTVNGTLAVAGFHFKIRSGRVLNPADGLPDRFREFGLGFNPLLKPVPDLPLPYFGYGTGVVRLSLGDNEELGGDVRGGAPRWFFLRDATVTVDGKKLVEGGRLVE